MNVKARDVMNRKVISIRWDTTLKEAIKIFSEHNINGVPVVDEKQQVVGIIKARKVLEYANKQHVVPFLDTAGWVSPYENTTGIIDYKKGTELLEKTKVDKVMDTKIVTVKEDTPGLKVAEIMDKKRIKHVPVIDQEGKLCGIIARADLISYLVSKLL